MRLYSYTQRRAVGDLMAEKDSLFSDYTFEKDALFARINLVGDELEMYYRVHDALAEKIIRPNLILYLRASTDTLMARIAFRDRPYERNMDREYIHQLNLTYESFFSNQDQDSVVLTIDTDDLDYVRSPESLKFVENRIRQTLRLPPFQQELPLEPQAD